MGKAQFPYRRVLLKLSGESLGNSGIDYSRVASISQKLRSFRQANIELAMVIGGGNILRGQQAALHGMERVTADYMGMLATVINALALQEACEKENMHTRVQTAIPIHNVAESYIRRKAMRHLEKGRIVIFAAGTGNPYFTTDTTASLRAVELNCDVMLKATNVDGVYDADPKKDKKARRLKEVSYMEALQRDLRVMDMTALTLCMENKIPVIVFDIFQDDYLPALLAGEDVGTFISQDSKFKYA